MISPLAQISTDRGRGQIILRHFINRNEQGKIEINNLLALWKVQSGPDIDFSKYCSQFPFESLHVAKCDINGRTRSTLLFPELNLLNYKKSQSMLVLCTESWDRWETFVMWDGPTFQFGHKYFKLMMLLLTAKSGRSHNFMNVVYHRYKLYKVGIGDFQTCKPV